MPELVDAPGAREHSPTDPSEFWDEILPGLGKVALRALVTATGLSTSACASIRSGRKRRTQGTGRLFESWAHNLDCAVDAQPVASSRLYNILMMVCQDPVAGAAVFEVWRYG